MADIEGTIAQTATVFNAGILRDVQVYLGPEDFTVAGDKVVAWRDSREGRLAAQFAEGEVTYLGPTGSIAQMVSLFSPGTLPGAVVYLGPDGWSLVSGRVSRWADISTGLPSLVSQAAEGGITYSGEIAQTAPAATQTGSAWRTVEGELAQTAPTPTQAATGWLPVAAQAAAPATQAATGLVFVAPRPATMLGARVGTQRVKKLYLGSTLLKEFAVGSGLFDADGNPLFLELADGTPITIELTE